MQAAAAGGQKGAMAGLPGKKLSFSVEKQGHAGHSETRDKSRQDEGAAHGRRKTRSQEAAEEEEMDMEEDGNGMPVIEDEDVLAGDTELVSEVPGGGELGLREGVEEDRDGVPAETLGTQGTIDGTEEISLQKRTFLDAEAATTTYTRKKLRGGMQRESAAEEPVLFTSHSATEEQLPREP